MEGGGAATNAQAVPAHVQLTQMATGCWISQLVSTAANLCIADDLAAGPKSASEIAGAARCNPRALHRFMRALANFSIVTSAGEQKFALTPLGEALKSGAPGSGSAWLANSQLMLAGAFLVGLGLGAEVDIIAYITSHYFGLLDFGKVYSSALAAFALAGALGPLVMGAGFDRTGSYRDPLILFFVAAAIAAALMTRLGPYRFGAPRTVPTQPILHASVAE
jgi:MFS family permease